MLHFPPDAPWIYAWLGVAALLGLLIGWLLGRSGHDRFRREADGLRTDLDQALEARRLAEGAMTESGALSADLQHRLDQTTTSLGDADREIGRLRSDLDAAETRIAQLEIELDAAGRGDDQEAALHSAQLDAARQEAGQLRAALSAASVDADARVSAAESEARQALARVEAVEDLLAAAEREAESLNRQLAEAPQPSAIDHTDGLTADLRAELDSAREEAAATARRIAEAEALLEETRSQLDEARAELHAARSVADAEESAEDALAARDHVVRELQARMTELVGIEDRLKAREAELGELRRSHAAVVAAKDAESRSLRQRLEALERRQAEPPDGADTAAISEALRAAEAELATLRRRSHHWEQEAAALRAGIGAGNDSPAEVTPAPVDLGSRLDRMQEILSDKEARIAYLADRIARLESNLGTTRRPTPVETAAAAAPPARPAAAAPIEPDDLTAIWGIGPAIARKLNRVGITSFQHIAVLNPDDQARLGDMLGEFLDRFEADDWVGQARRLIEARGGTVPTAPLAPIRLTPPPAAAAPDDLTEIKGIGPFIQATLNDLGVNTFSQIAAWTDEDVEEFGEALVIFQGRITREGWVDQARRLMRGR
ncbi:MAG: hypothetical protein KJ698_00485 [Actinobacteria bacterium]|nr:hypothetical protein [Actinomycetota bacterium]